VTDWESIVDAAIRRTETSGVSPIRAVPIDLIASAVWREIDRSVTGGRWPDADLDAALARFGGATASRCPMQFSPPLTMM
jgi:hypothetical protein